MHQFVERRELGCLGGDNNLAADRMRNTLLFAELHHGRGAFNAKLGLERAGLVVEPGVDDAAVVACLVQGDAGFLFEDHGAEVRMFLLEFKRNGKAHNAATDNGDIASDIRHDDPPEIVHKQCTPNGRGVQ